MKQREVILVMENRRRNEQIKGNEYEEKATKESGDERQQVALETPVPANEGGAEE